MIVSDVHLGHAPPEVADAFRRFLERVPDLGEHLIVNGDLFEFWFEYREVIPKRAFPTLEALGRVRRAGVQLTVTGGNHDRWGGGSGATSWTRPSTPGVWSSSSRGTGRW